MTRLQEISYKKYLKCMSEIDKMLEIGSNRTYEQYRKTLHLISSAKYYINIFYSDILYLLYSKDLDLYKIGKTNDISVRLKAIKKETDIKQLEVVYIIPNHSFLEKKLHNQFHHLNVPVKKKQTHREWFKYDDEIINEFERLQNGN
jgi:hypothetical protein